MNDNDNMNDDNNINNDISMSDNDSMSDNESLSDNDNLSEIDDWTMLSDDTNRILNMRWLEIPNVGARPLKLILPVHIWRYSAIPMDILYRIISRANLDTKYIMLIAGLATEAPNTEESSLESSLFVGEDIMTVDYEWEDGMMYQTHPRWP